MKKTENVVRGRDFGAVKANVIRILKHGYRPDWSLLAIKKADRQRIRRFAVAHGTTIIDAVSAILDAADVPKVRCDEVSRTTGLVAPLVGNIVAHSSRRNSTDILAEVREGKHDALIRTWMNLDVKTSEED